MMSDNVSKECPVNTDAMKNAEKMFGPDLCSMKGKTVRQKPNKVAVDFHDPPKEMTEKCENLTLSADTFFVNKMPMLITRDDEIKFQTISFMENRSKNTRWNSSKKQQTCARERDSSCAC